MLDALERRSLALAGILVTHHHADPFGGIGALRCVLDDSGAKPILPSSIAIERRINPYLRSCLRRDETEVVGSALAHGAAGPGAVDVSAALREWKNPFR